MQSEKIDQDFFGFDDSHLQGRVWKFLTQNIIFYDYVGAETVEPDARSLVSKVKSSIQG